MKKIILIFTLVIIHFCLKAAVRTATVTGNWNAAATWQGGNIPISTDDVVINNNVNLTLDNNYTCNSVSIAAGANASALILSGFTLNVTTTITITAPSAAVNKRITVGTGVLNCGSVFMTAGTAGNRDCLISISTGTVNVTGDITMPGASDRNYVLFSGAGFLNISGDFLGGAGGITLIGTSTINYNGAGNQTIRNFTYDNLTLSNSGVKTLEATTTSTKT